MNPTCDSALEWYAKEGASVTHPLASDARQAAHIASCEACRETVAKYVGFAESCRQQLVYTVTPEREQAWVQQASYQTEQVSSDLVNAFEYSLTPDKEASFLAAARQQQQPVVVNERQRWPIRTLALAAAVLFTLGSAWVLFTSQKTSELVQGKPNTPVTTSQIQIASQSGQVRLDRTSARGVGSFDVGTRIRTDLASHFQFVQADNATVTVNPMSELEVANWSVGSTTLKLHSGTVLADVVHREPGAVFEVVTENARVVVVGTEFSVTYGEDSKTVVRGTSGTVRVERLDGTFVDWVRAGDVLSVDDAVAQLEDIEQADLAPSPGESVLKKRAPRKVSEVSSLTLARRALADGNALQAIEILEEMTDTPWQRYALLGDAYQMSGAFTEAEMAYKLGLRTTSAKAAPLFIDLANLQEVHLKDAKAARQTWQAYLKAHPKGTAASKAHLALGLGARDADRWEDAQVHFWTILGQFGETKESGVAVTVIGGRLLKEQRWTDAETFFKSHVQGDGVKAEAALVGLIRVDIGRGDREAGLIRLEEYSSRFPTGKRRGEVRRMTQVLKPIEK